MGPETPWEHIQAFRAAITWGEPFIVCIAAFHAMMLGATVFILKRDGSKGRLAWLIVISLMVMSSERLNRYGSHNWESFATQDYFDNNGLFVSLFFSAPLLILSFGILVVYLREASRLLVEVKKQELAYKKRMQAKDARKTGKKDD